MPDLQTEYDAILPIINDDKFYEQPDDKKINQVKQFVEHIKTSVLKQCQRDHVLQGMILRQINTTFDWIDKIKNPAELKQRFEKTRADLLARRALLLPEAQSVFDLSSFTAMQKTLLVSYITQLKRFIHDGVPTKIKVDEAALLQTKSKGMPVLSEFFVAFLNQALKNTTYYKLNWNVIADKEKEMLLIMEV